MGSTTTGLPWPEPSAPTRDGALAIRQLAEAVDLRAPMSHVAYGRGGYTTNAYGGIIINIPFNCYGSVAMTEQEGFSCIKAQGTPPAGQAWINVFHTVDGSLTANQFILLNFIVFG